MNEVDEKVDNTLKNVSLRDQNKPASTQPVKKITKKNSAIAVIILLAIAYFGGEDIANALDLFPEDIPAVILEPADIQMYTFSDPFDNDSVNVEFWLINIGEETGTEIEVFVRARDHNGTILFSEIVDTTTLLLRENETCSGWYTVLIDDAEYVTHTIEVSWCDGRNSYSKKTNL